MKKEVLTHEQWLKALHVFKKAIENGQFKTSDVPLVAGLLSRANVESEWGVVDGHLDQKFDFDYDLAISGIFRSLEMVVPQIADYYKVLPEEVQIGSVQAGDDFKGTKVIFGDFHETKDRLKSCDNLKVVAGSFQLFDNNQFLTTLPNLQFVGGHLTARLSSLKSLPSLKFVGGCLDACESENLEDLKALHEAGDIDLSGTKIEKTSQLKNLKIVHSNLVLSDGELHKLESNKTLMFE